MIQKKSILKASKVIPMSATAKEKIAAVAKEIKGKELFPDKVAQAKETFSELKSLPI